jgi:hypothetical protein
MSIRFLIIVTSPARRWDRFTGSPCEWVNAWGFPQDKEVAARVPAGDSVSFYNEVSELTQPTSGQEAIIWLNTMKLGQRQIKGKLDQIIEHMNLGESIDDLWVAYHDIVREHLPSRVHGRSSEYSLEDNDANKVRFRPLLTPDKTLNAMAPFEDLLECFRIDMPKRVARFRHRIAHLFTPIDIDLQGLIASNFRPDYCEKVVAAHRAVATMVIEEARKMKGELYMVATVSQKKVIDEKWQQAEKELRRMEPLLTALEKGELDEHKKEEAENFRKAFRELLRILDELDDELRALDERRK